MYLLRSACRLYVFVPVGFLFLASNTQRGFDDELILRRCRLNEGEASDHRQVMKRIDNSHLFDNRRRKTYNGIWSTTGQSTKRGRTLKELLHVSTVGEQTAQVLQLLLISWRFSHGLAGSINMKLRIFVQILRS